jgi:hypothetical protein
MVKQSLSITLDKDLIDKIEKDAYAQQRSISFIINSYLLRHYNTKTKA